MDFNAWLNNQTTSVISASGRAIAAWDRIQRRPTTLTLRRNGVFIPAQQVRVEYATTSREVSGDAVTAYRRPVWVFGVKDHPSVTDTNIQVGDEFGIEIVSGQPERFRVQDIVRTSGEVQATCYRIE